MMVIVGMLKNTQLERVRSHIQYLLLLCMFCQAYLVVVYNKLRSKILTTSSRNYVVLVTCDIFKHGPNSRIIVIISFNHGWALVLLPTLAAIGVAWLVLSVACLSVSVCV